MSRIGKLPVAIPAGVEVKLEDGNIITVKGPKGTLSRKLVDEMTIDVSGAEVTVTRPSALKRHKQLHGLTRTLIANMVEGVTNGYKKVLEINGVGYRAAKSGNKLTLTLGYSHPVEMIDPEGITTTSLTRARVSSTIPSISDARLVRQVRSNKGVNVR